MRDEALFLTVMKLWAATAWADGILAEKERRLLDGLIRNAAVSAETRAAALAFLDAKVALEQAEVDGLSADERAGVYRAACRLVTIDRRFDDAEKAFLSRLAGRLGLTGEDAAAIEAEYLRPAADGVSR
jgi:uncharacterized membrane protein YebE (DUF533 family)